MEQINKISAQQPYKGPIQTAKSVEILYSDSGFVKARITGPVLNRYISDTASNVEFPKGTYVVLYDHHLLQTSSLKANYAISREKKQLLEARGNVVVINERGEQLNTERLYWNQKTERIFSNEFVKITTPDKIIYGQGFESNQDFSKYKIFNIKGTVSVSEKAQNNGK